MPSAKSALVEAIVFVITIRAAFAVDIKRIHDRERTAYLLVPLYLAALMMIALDGTGNNPLYSLLVLDVPGLQEGYPVKLLMLICLLIAFFLYAIWMLIELGFRRGTSGPSKYGPDPLADQPEQK